MTNVSNENANMLMLSSRDIRYVYYFSLQSTTVFQVFGHKPELLTTDIFT